MFWVTSSPFLTWVSQMNCREFISCLRYIQIHGLCILLTWAFVALVRFSKWWLLFYWLKNFKNHCSGDTSKKLMNMFLWHVHVFRKRMCGFHQILKCLIISTIVQKWPPGSSWLLWSTLKSHFTAIPVYDTTLLEVRSVEGQVGVLGWLLSAT